MSKSTRRRAAQKQFGTTRPVLDRETVMSPPFQKRVHDLLDARIQELLAPQHPEGQGQTAKGENTAPDKQSLPASPSSEQPDHDIPTWDTATSTNDIPASRESERPNHELPELDAAGYKKGLLAPDACDRNLLPAIDDGPRTADLPLWMPQGEDLQKMPIELRQTVAEIVYPIYEEQVVRATGMDRNLGASLVYLLWLEVLDQFDVKRAYCEDLRLGGTHDRTQVIDRYLKLVGAKLRIGNFMLRLREFRLKEAKGQSVSTSPPSVAPAAEPLATAPVADHYPLPAKLEELDLWKNQETLSKTETENQDPKAKTEDSSWKNQEPLSKIETENQGLKPKTQDQSWKNQETLSKSQVPETEKRKPETEDPSSKYQELLTKTSISENQDLRPTTQVSSWSKQSTTHSNASDSKSLPATSFLPPQESSSPTLSTIADADTAPPCPAPTEKQ